MTTDFQIKNLDIEKVFNKTDEFRLKFGLHNKYTESINVQMNITINQEIVFNCTKVIGSDDFDCNNNTFYQYERLPEKAEIFIESEFILKNYAGNGFNLCVEIQSNLNPRNKDKECILVD